MRSSTKRRSLFALAGSLVAEISLPKLVLAWVLLIGLPGFLLGIVPLVGSAWLGKVYARVGVLHRDMVCCDRFDPRCSGLVRRQAGFPTVRKQLLVSAGPGHPAGLRDLSRGASAPPRRVPSQRHRHSQTEYGPSGRRRDVGRADRRRRVWACRGGMAGFALGGGFFADLTSLHLLVPIAFANAVVVMGIYFAFAALTWGVADAAMAQPRDRSPSRPALRMVEAGAWPTSRISMS